MTIEDYIKDVIECCKIAQKNKDQHSYDTYYGMLCGAREVCRLATVGYNVLDNVGEIINNNLYGRN